MNNKNEPLAPSPETTPGTQATPGSLTRREEQFILKLHNIRHNTNEVLLCLPFIVALVFGMIGFPILAVLCEISLGWVLLLALATCVGVFLFYFIRKKRILHSFTKIKEVGSKVDLSVLPAEIFENTAEGKVFMFPYSESMITVLYNWFSDLHVLGDGKMKMYQVIYNDGAPVYLAVREADLVISEKTQRNYEKETFATLQLSDMVHGKAVNQKICERLSQTSDNRQKTR